MNLAPEFPVLYSMNTIYSVNRIRMYAGPVFWVSTYTHWL